MSRGWQFVITLACLLFVGAIVAATYSIVQNGSLAQRTQDALIESCQNSRGPLNDYFQGELEATRNTDPSLFPDIPPDVFQQLLGVKIERLQDVITVTDPAACADQYR